MATTPLERLMFAQGGRCFFCDHALKPEEASVEHLLAQSKGGGNADENCVACCQALNRLLGNMPLKDKIKVVLNQRGPFHCPNRPVAKKAPAAKPKVLDAPAKPAASKAASTLSTDPYALVLSDLRKRGNSRPGKPAALLNTIRSTLKQAGKDAEVDAVLKRLKQEKKVVELEGKVTYKLG